MRQFRTMPVCVVIRRIAENPNQMNNKINCCQIDTSRKIHSQRYKFLVFFDLILVKRLTIAINFHQLIDFLLDICCFANNWLNIYNLGCLSMVLIDWHERFFVEKWKIFITWHPNHHIYCELVMKQLPKRKNYWFKCV